MSNRSGIVLVTGAAGFAGSHLLEELAGSCDAVGWARSDPPGPLSSLARWKQIDLLDRDSVRREIRDVRPPAIYHLAGAPSVAQSWANTTATLASNVLTTHNLLDAVRRANIACRILVIGSAQVYAASTSALHEDCPLAPASPYALSKLAQEQLGLRGFTEDGIGVILARPFNHTGPRQSPSFAAPAMARQIALIERGAVKAPIAVGNLEAQRDITDVRDIVRAYRLLIERGTAGSIYNVASGVARPIRAVLDGLIKRARVSVEVATDPNRLRPHDTPVLLGDSTRLSETTGWTPTITFDRMLDDLLDYWRAVARS